MKCLVRPVMTILYGLTEVNLTVSPMTYLHSPQAVVMTMAYFFPVSTAHRGTGVLEVSSLDVMSMNS